MFRLLSGTTNRLIRSGGCTAEDLPDPGGYLLAGFGKNIAFSVFVDSIMQAMGFVEVSVSLLKSLLFGLIIGTVSSYYGLRVKRSITEIPQATTKAVMGSLRLVFVTDAVITILFFI